MSSPSSVTRPHRCRVAERYLVCLLLLLFFFLLVFSVSKKSPTLDEQNHIARGLAYLKTGDLRLSQEHPPGVNAWETWPLLLDETIRLPLDSASWANAEWYGFADQLLWQANDGEAVSRLVFATRVPVMWLTLILGTLVYRWARALGGRWAGLLALSLLVFDPNILAHGRLTTTDMGITCLVVAAMFALWRAMPYSSRPYSPRPYNPRPPVSLHHSGWQHWLLAGVLFGLAQVSKFSALVLGPVIALAIVLVWIQRIISQKSSSAAVREARQWISRLAFVFGIGFIVVWAVYGFEWGPIAALGNIPGPAPSYFAGIQTILKRTGGGTTSFLMGQYSESGWWTYFPIAFAIKTPLPTLLLLIAALGLWVYGYIASRFPAQSPHYRQSDPDDPTATHPERGTSLNHLACLILPVLAFWTIAMSSSFNIGYRHILPSLPFLYILTGWQIAAYFSRKQHHRSGIRRHPIAVIRYLLLAVCCFSLAVTAFSILPHYLSFFNVLAGGSEQGYRLLVDSNLDWGQDLPGLAERFNNSPVPINLSWFGAAHPEAYHFPFHPLPGFWRFGGDPAAFGLNPYNPAPGIYAISASNLQGIQLADRDSYARFRAQDPLGNIGHSILIYEVPQRQAPAEAVVLAVPTSQLAAQERSLLERGATVRQFDPASGVIVPFVDTVWFITPEPPGWGEVVRQGPGYVVISGPFGREYELLLKAPCPCDLDTRFADIVALRHHQVNDLSLSTSNTLIVEAVWYVIGPPHRAAKSFAHLLDANGHTLAGWDGIASPATCWQANDRLTQRYTIALPQDLGPGTYQVEIGWYDAETLQRWPLTIDGKQAGDRLLLPDVEIKK
ncbi:MAG: phospholipid carrier-dependent glycosyltransferase [Anaerolineae bacterium]|nr:phospholipid carrier-dependent glycosyltransferase [Anaerolineae bacterium]